MRPIKLEIQGLTAYREPVELDFTELDLFGITGPTGAGKSSLVDAITYALFGRAPRVGNQIKELISQGSDRIKVSLEFSANGARYRVHRASARKGQAPVQLERFNGGEWQPIADRATEVTQEIEDLLRMDYEAFIRSVILPQGEFAEFLAGDRDQRRKVLDGLLQLGVYTIMGQKANAIAARESADADRIAERLATELADATPEALKAAKAHLAEMEEHAVSLASARETLDLACKTADALAAEREKGRLARDAFTSASKKLADARDLLAGGEKKLGALDAQIRDLQSKAVETNYDKDLQLRLTKCVPILRGITRAADRLGRLTREIESSSKDAEKSVHDAQAADKRHAELLRIAEARHDEYEEARRTNATALLRQGLTEGDPCPVCGQQVAAIPPGEHLQLDRFKQASDAARKDADAAQQTLNAARQRAAVAEQGLANLRAQLEEATAERSLAESELAGLLEGTRLSAGDIEPRLEALHKAEQELKSLTEQIDRLVTQREQATADIHAAQGDVIRYDAEVKSAEVESSAAITAGEQAASAIAEAARANDWSDVAKALESGDPRNTLRARLQEAARQETVANQQIGLSRARITEIQKNIELAKKLRSEEKEHREAARIARDLASLLRADKFPTFIRERAMKTLAAGGSEWLKQISGGRYDLVVEGQDFVVEDLWNAGDRRSVKTLSGGETFLASLALALALAEQLPALASPGTESSLESLFIDEGFSHLDNETLDVVASALEVLGQDRRRLIGVITHVPELAERMPARIVVHKSQSGSTVTVE